MALAHRVITGTFSARVPDTADSDLVPDRIPLEGRATLRPEYSKPLVIGGEQLVIEPIPVVIIGGVLQYELLSGDDVVLQDLHLPVTVDDRANQSWSWRITFDHLTLGPFGEDVTLPDQRFPVEPGDGPLDLSEVAGRWSGGGLITRGAPGPGLVDIVPEGGVLTFVWDDGRTREVDAPDLGGDISAAITAYEQIRGS